MPVLLFFSACPSSSFCGYSPNSAAALLRLILPLHEAGAEARRAAAQVLLAEPSRAGCARESRRGVVAG